MNPTILSSLPAIGVDAAKAFLATRLPKNGSSEIWIKIGHNKFFKADFTPDGDLVDLRSVSTIGKDQNGKSLPFDVAEQLKIGAPIRNGIEYLLEQSRRQEGGIFFLSKQPSERPIKSGVDFYANLTVEIDDLPSYEQQIALHREFAAVTGLHQMAMLSSGGKSIHVELGLDQHYPVEQAMYLHRLLVLGLLADPATCNEWQPVRLPGFYRLKKSGELTEQRLIGLNPNARYSYDQAHERLKAWYAHLGLPMPSAIPDKCWAEAKRKVLGSSSHLEPDEIANLAAHGHSELEQAYTKDGKLIKGAVHLTPEQKLISARYFLRGGYEGWQQRKDAEIAERAAVAAHRLQSVQNIGQVEGTRLSDLIEQANNRIGTDFYAQYLPDMAASSGSKARVCCPWHESASGNSAWVSDYIGLLAFACPTCTGGKPVDAFRFWLYNRYTPGCSYPSGKQYVEDAITFLDEVGAAIPDNIRNWTPQAQQINPEVQFKHFHKALFDCLRQAPSAASAKPRRQRLEIPQQETFERYDGSLPEPQPGVMRAIEFEPGQFTDIAKQAVLCGFKVVVNASGAGSGKSTETAKWKPSDFLTTLMYSHREEAKKIIHISNQIRLPSTPELEANSVEIPVRNNGLVIDPDRQTPLGKPFRRHPKKGDDENLRRTSGNCFQAPLFIELGRAGLDIETGEAASSPICQQCPFFATCGKPESIGKPGQGFRAERRRAETESNIVRSHFDSNPATGSSTIVVVDEASVTVKPDETRVYLGDDFEKQCSKLEQNAPDLAVLLIPFKNNIRGLFNADTGKHGLNTEAVLERLGERPEWLSTHAIAQIRDAVLYSIEEIFDSEIDGVNTSKTTKKLASLKDKKKRRERNFENLKVDLWQLELQVKEYEKSGGFSGFLLSNTEEITSARDQITELTQKINDLDIETKDLEKQITVLEEQRKNERHADRLIKRHERRETSERLSACPTQGFAEILEIWAGDIDGAIRVQNGKITLTLPNDRHAEILRSARIAFLLDATANRFVLARYLGIDPSKILFIRARAPEVTNVKRFQISNFGMAAKSRAESTDEKIAATIASIKAKHSNVGIIDHQNKIDINPEYVNEVKGWHFGNGRGSNEFKDCNALIVVGVPMPNVGAVQDRYRALGSIPELNSEQYYQYLVDSELIQEDGRLRAALRPDQDLYIYYLNDYSLPFEAEQINTDDIVPGLFDRQGQTIHRIVEGIVTAARKGLKLTQETIAAAADLGQSWISQFFSNVGGWRVWKEIIGDLIRDIFQPVDSLDSHQPALSEDERIIVDQIMPVVAEMAVGDPREAVTELGNIYQAFGGKAFSAILQAIPRPIKKRLLTAFVIASLPDQEISQIQQWCGRGAA